MTEAVAGPRSNRRPGWMRRWALPVVVAVTIATAWGADRFLTRSPMAGIVPGDAEWIAVAGDFPAFWRALEASDVRSRMARAGKFPQGEWMRGVRDAFGIRPTPSRWRNWLGPGLVCARARGAVGISARPGLLLRTCVFLFAPPPDAHGIRTHGDWSYAWRDGFLVASRSPSYVTSALRGDPVDRPAEKVAIDIRWTGAPPGEVTIRAADGLPVRGKIELEVPPLGAPLTLVDAFPVPAIAAVYGSNAEALAPVTDALIAWLPGGEFVRDILLDTVGILPEESLGDGSESAFAWISVDLAGNVPIPEWIALQRRTTAMARLAPPAEAVSFEWNGLSGWVLPWVGERLSFCMAEDGTHRYWAGREGQMPEWAGRLRETPAVDGDIAVEISWDKAALAALQLVRWAGARELIERRNSEDVERELVPRLELLLPLGALRLSGRSDGTSVRFDGHLAMNPGNES